MSARRHLVFVTLSLAVALLGAACSDNPKAAGSGGAGGSGSGRSRRRSRNSGHCPRVSWPRRAQYRLFGDERLTPEHER